MRSQKTAQPTFGSTPRTRHAVCPCSVAVQGSGAVVRVALRPDRHLAAAAEYLDHAVRLHVVVADRDPVADRLPDAHVSNRLGRDDEHVSRGEGGLACSPRAP